MYAYDVLLILSTCSDLRRMLRIPKYLVSARSIIPCYFSNTGIPRISSFAKASMRCSWCSTGLELTIRRKDG